MIIVFRIADTAQVLIGIAVLFTFALQFYVPMDISRRRIGPSIPKDKHNVSQILFRAGIILIMGGVSAAVPKLEPFIGLVGSVFFSVLGIFRNSIPNNSVIIVCFFHCHLYFDLGLCIPAVVETVFRYPDNFGRGNWILIKNIFLVIFSILALVTGSYVSIGGIIKLYA